MSNPSVASYELGRPRSSAPTIDKYAMIALSACVFALIVSPLLIFTTTGGQRPPNIMEPSSGDQNFLACHGCDFRSIGGSKSCIASANSLGLPTSSVCSSILRLLEQAFCGLSARSARSLDYLQQVMVVTSIVLPVMLAARTVDIMRGVFLCFAFSLVLNLLFVLGGSVTIAQYGSTAVDIGYQGYFLGKNYLGECAVVAFLLALHEMRHRGWRRALGIIVVADRHFAYLLERFQNGSWPCSYVSIPGSVYVDRQKDNAHFSGNHSIVHPTLLRRRFQRI